MEFESDILGEFSESFRFVLRGNEEPVACQFKGHVVRVQCLHKVTSTRSAGVMLMCAIILAKRARPSPIFLFSRSVGGPKPFDLRKYKTPLREKSTATGYPG